MKTACLFSWFKGFEETFFSDTLKLSLLWFDDIVFQSPTDDIITRVFPKVFEKEGLSPGVSKEICKFIHPIQHYLNGYKFGEPEVWIKDSFIAEATHTALENYFEEKHGPWPEKWMLLREVALTGCGVIDAINLLSYLSQKMECYLVPTDFEHRVLVEITKSIVLKSDFEFFSEIAQFRLPRFKEMAWERIFELRNHELLVNFRKTLAELNRQLARQNSKDLKKIFDEIERKYIKELLILLKPSVLDSVAKGIATNIPLPLPLNPIGVLDAIKSAYESKKTLDRYGWLFFLYELT
jgi:hypothetical protein